MVNINRPNRYPGTDDRTGWPLAVTVLCRDLVELCHVAVHSTPSECADEPEECNFHGRFPRLEHNSDGDSGSGGSLPSPRAPEAMPGHKQGQLV